MVTLHAAAVRNSKSSCVASPEHPARSRGDTDTGPPLTGTPPAASAATATLLSPPAPPVPSPYSPLSMSVTLLRQQHCANGVVWSTPLGTSCPLSTRQDSAEPSGAGVCQQSSPLYGGVVLRDAHTTYVCLAIHLWKNIWLFSRFGLSQTKPQ